MGLVWGLDDVSGLVYETANAIGEEVVLRGTVHRRARDIKGGAISRRRSVAYSVSSRI